MHNCPVLDTVPSAGDLMVGKSGSLLEEDIYWVDKYISG